MEHVHLAGQQVKDCYVCSGPGRNRLQFGLPDVVPESALAAWGGRLIHQEVVDGGTGVVYDRQDAIGPDEARATLLRLLNESETPGLQAAMTEYARGVHGSVTVRTVVYSDELVTVVASPNGSFGYLYVTAYLKGGS